MIESLVERFAADDALHGQLRPRLVDVLDIVVSALVAAAEG